MNVLVIIVSIIIVAMMYGFIFIMFKNIVRKINENSKKYFLDSLQEYNSIVLEQAQKLDGLQKRIKVSNEIQSENMKKIKDTDEPFYNYVDENEASTNKFMIENYESGKDRLTEYREENFFYNYKELQKSFNVNGEQIIRNFIKNHEYNGNITVFKTLNELQKRFKDKEIVYDVMLLTKKQQIELLDELLSKTLKKYINFDKYKSNISKFDFLKFLGDIDDFVQVTDPTIYIYVGNVNYNYDYIDKNVKTLYYKNMIEGIIIKYQNRIFDYSI